MPELPEVQTTVSGLKKVITGLKIKDVWTDFHKNSKHNNKKGSIKNPSYFKQFKKEISGKKILNVKRRGKNILINLSNKKTILIHMKMTGHFLYGKYQYNKKEDSWESTENGPLKDSFNRFIHFLITLSNGRHLAFSDMRKFGKIILIDDRDLSKHPDLKDLGPEPLDNSFILKKFKERIFLKPNGKIKQVLIDQKIISGIGNIYADETLWKASIHPEEMVKNIPDKKLKDLFEAIKELLKKGVKLGGDSTSDYRNIKGQKGNFQEDHKAYRQTGKKCQKRGCFGIIKRIVVGSRGTHFCPTHQKLSNSKNNKK